VLLSLVLCCVLGVFVFLPRFHEAIENEVTTVLSTEVADAIGNQVPDGANVEAGTYRISLTDLQRQIVGGSENLQVEGMVLRGDGGDIVLGFEVTNASAEYRFTPVANGGALELTNMRGEGGVVQQLLAPEALGGAIERSVNGYLDAQGLTLQDVAVEGDELVLVLADG
jgi:hypothetical protein